MEWKKNANRKSIRIRRFDYFTVVFILLIRIKWKIIKKYVPRNWNFSGNLFPFVRIVCVFLHEQFLRCRVSVAASQNFNCNQSECIQISLPSIGPQRKPSFVHIRTFGESISMVGFRVWVCTLYTLLSHLILVTYLAV